MNNIWSTYLQMFNDKNQSNNIKSIINEDTTDDQADNQNTQNDENDENDDSSSNTQEENNKSADLKFSADLAAEFGNTCNKFTTLAAKVVKDRTVDKETTENLTKILNKLKSLIDAANNSI